MFLTETTVVADAGYTGPATMDLTAGRRRISSQERAKKFKDGRGLYCGGLNHRAAECVARKKAQTFMAAGVEGMGVGTRTGSEESGKEKLKCSRIALQLMIKVLF